MIKILKSVEAVKKYTEKNPEVYRETVNGHNNVNPNVSKDFLSRYTKKSQNQSECSLKIQLKKY
jgi:hypothetical protein